MTIQFTIIKLYGYELIYLYVIKKSVMLMLMRKVNNSVLNHKNLISLILCHILFKLFMRIKIVCSCVIN